MTMNLALVYIHISSRHSNHRRTGRYGVLAIATWAAWFWAAQGRLLTKKKEEIKGRKGRFNIFATAVLRTQSAPDSNLHFAQNFVIY